MSPFGADSWLRTGPGSARFGTHCAANVSALSSHRIQRENKVKRPKHMGALVQQIKEYL